MKSLDDLPKLFVYCDDPHHAPRQVAVTNFHKLPGGEWHEQAASRAATANVGSGRTLVHDKPGEPGWALDSDVPNAATRTRFELTCRKCRQPVKVDARRETLFALLDTLRDTGLTSVPLSFLAASLQEQSKGQ